MHLNQTHFVKSGERSLLEKAGIYEGDLLRSVRSFPCFFPISGESVGVVPSQAEVCDVSLQKKRTIRLHTFSSLQQDIT